MIKCGNLEAKRNKELIGKYKGINYEELLFQTRGEDLELIKEMINKKWRKEEN